jgi:hypothetical protein
LTFSSILRCMSSVGMTLQFGHAYTAPRTVPPEEMRRLWREIDAPAEAIAEYCHRLQKERRGLVRPRAEFLVTQIDWVTVGGAAGFEQRVEDRRAAYRW